MEKVEMGASSSRAACILHPGAWLKRHMEAYVFLAWPPFTICRATGGLPRGMGYFLTLCLRNLLTLEVFKAVDV